VRVSAGWIPPVLQAMKEEAFTACQPLIRSDVQPDNFEYAGAAGGYIDRDGFTFCAGRIFDTFESDSNQYPGNREVFWASGASLFIEADAFHEVSGLDADFFAHMEEIDLCWRLKNRGLRVGVCGASTVFHLGGGTLNKVSPFKTYLNFRNNLFLLVKNHHRKQLLPMLLRRMLLDGIAALKFASSSEWPLFLAVWKAHLAFYWDLPATWRKRRLEIQAVDGRRRNYNGWYRRSIVLAYFGKKQRTFSELDSSAFSRRM
jgi:GT2 family glycosyltransferase